MKDYKPVKRPVSEEFYEPENWEIERKRMTDEEINKLKEAYNTLKELEAKGGGPGSCLHEVIRILEHFIKNETSWRALDVQHDIMANYKTQIIQKAESKLKHTIDQLP